MRSDPSASRRRSLFVTYIYTCYPLSPFTFFFFWKHNVTLGNDKDGLTAPILSNLLSISKPQVFWHHVKERKRRWGRLGWLHFFSLSPFLARLGRPHILSTWPFGLKREENATTKPVLLECILTISCLQLFPLPSLSLSLSLWIYNLFRSTQRTIRATLQYRYHCIMDRSHTSGLQLVDNWLC